MIQYLQCRQINTCILLSRSTVVHPKGLGRLKWCPVLKLWEPLQDKDGKVMHTPVDDNSSLFFFR